MDLTNSPMPGMHAVHLDLGNNEREYTRMNTTVRVDSISANHKVAMCSVAQCHFGAFRRSMPASELRWRAERALAPFSKLGITPLITVRPERKVDNVHAADGPRGWPAAIWQWMGYPLAPEGHGHVLLAHDPFGWRRAMAFSEARMGAGHTA